MIWLIVFLWVATGVGVAAAYAGYRALDGEATAGLLALGACAGPMMVIGIGGLILGRLAKDASAERDE